MRMKKSFIIISGGCGIPIDLAVVKKGIHAMLVDVNLKDEEVIK